MSARPLCVLLTIALAAGPNYNDPGNRERDKRAYESLEHALRLRPQVSEPERAYIDALAKRYTKEPPPDRKALDAAYADAMREVARRYPDDLDAATLFAESLMDLRPWDLWTADGGPEPGTTRGSWPSSGTKRACSQLRRRAAESAALSLSSQQARAELGQTAT